MFKKLNEELGQSSNKTGANASTANSGTVLAFDPFCPHKKPTSDDGFPDNICLFLEVIAKAKARYEVNENETDIMFGVKLPFPSSPRLKEILALMPPKTKLQLLNSWDACLAAAYGGATEAEVHEQLRALYDIVNQFVRKVTANCAQNDANSSPTEQDLINAYEEEQYLKRKALGEPVLFRNGRLYFEKIIFEHGFQPAPFPGLDLYTRDEELVDPQAFAKWLDDMKPQREKRQAEGVGFLGCPTCPVHADYMVWYSSQCFGPCGSESYREYVKQNGIPNMSLSFFTWHMHFHPLDH